MKQKEPRRVELSEEHISQLSWAVTKISSLSQAAHLLSSLGSEKECENEVTKPNLALVAALKLQGPQEGQNGAAPAGGSAT